MSKRNKRSIIILEQCKFDWTPEQIKQAEILFNQGTKPSQVAEIMNQKVIDIGLLFIHLAEAGKVKSVKGA